jgi:hypothetical protein
VVSFLIAFSRYRVLCLVADFTNKQKPSQRRTPFDCDSGLEEKMENAQGLLTLNRSKRGMPKGSVRGRSLFLGILSFSCSARAS